MEFENLIGRQPKVSRRLLSATIPVLFVAISYVDPGKWAAAAESGARFGFDLVLPVLIFNLAAILCHYMTARIAVITGKDLAQICSEEYDNITCIFLGAQAEVSMIALDLMMVLGTAYGLNILFGIDLFTGVFLTAVNAGLFPFLAILFEHGRVKFLATCISIFILVSYFCGVFTSHSGNALFVGGMLTRLSGESAFALMSLLGAHIMPHNFYLHSSVVQKDKQSTDVPKGALCHDHFWAVLCIFSGIFLVNYLLMNSAANVFYTTGLLNFQDALSLLDQVFRSSVAPMALIMLMFFSNQITALSWSLGGQVVVNTLFKMDIPGWLHHSTIRIIAIIPALCCVWNSGAEGIYQMLIFTQVVVALLLPSSVIPLFRVASSRAIMGVYRTSRFEDFLVLISCVGMLGLKVIFFIELIFGNSDWVTNLRWNTGSSVPIAYVFLVGAASVSFCLMLWLAATPLKSATYRIDTQIWEWDVQSPVPETFVEEEELNDVSVSKYTIDKPREKQESLPTLEKPLGSFPDLSRSHNLNLPDTHYDSENFLHLASSEEKPEISNLVSSVCHEEVSVAEGDANSDTTNRGEGSDSESQEAHALKREPVDVVEKTLTMEGELQNPRDDGDSWECEEPTKVTSETNQSPISEGPGSLRSLSGENDDAGSGTGSLSTVAGLGRAARRQLTIILDEFWEHMFDYYGQPTAKAKKLDVLLGLDTKEDLRSSATSAKLDSNRKDPPGFFPSVGGGADSLISSPSGLYNSPRQQGQGMFEPSYGVQMGSSSFWSTPPRQLLDTNFRGCSTLDPSERRYSSMQIPASSGGYDQQPATVHGYQLSLYLNRLNRLTQERSSGFSNGQIESIAPKSTSSVTSHYADSFARPLGRKTPNGIIASKPPGFHNIPISRNSSLQPDKPFYELASPRPENANTSITPKKYYSSPDISGLRIPSHQDALLLDKSGKWDKSAAYGQTMGSSAYERAFSSISSRGGAPSGVNEISPKVCSDAFSLQISSGSNPGSRWSRQPFEQFGVADKNAADSNTQETASVVDLEAKLLQSFRYSILKILKLDGSDRLFRHNDGADEDLIDRVAARERFLYEAESLQMNRPNNAGLQQFYSEADHTKFLVTSVPHCGEGCVYKVHLFISFGVWCIHRLLELSLMESRPELWGKYTYVLNRLQGIIDPAFFKPRSPMSPCFCLQLPDGWQEKSSPPVSNGSLPPHAKQGRGKCTTSAMVLEMIKDVEMAISCRKGRTGTAAGDVAFPGGKKNLSSVLKRYKRRLNKPVVSQESGSASRRVSSPLQYGS
uniref:Ethylene-insensitive protein 2 EIN2 n=1 Tax=Gymnema sylvestre TaxID=4068 RepID=A0A976RUI7_GYMSY|nr:ethylene-insensitive protein 2 EIN2 [Gymnema sylvestre]